MEKSIIIIPDVHGREFWRDGVSKRKPGEKIIFLGDYTDPYPDEGISHEVIPGMIKEIMEIPDTILLLGNHDLSYLYSDSPKVRYDWDPLRKREIRGLLGNRDKFKLGWILERDECPGNIIFTHAGLLKRKYQRLADGRKKQKPVDIIGFFEDMWKNDDPELPNYLFDISWLRGGYSQYGSLVWADGREHLSSENEFWSHDYQVFGHTILIQGHIIERPTFAMVDCQRPVRMWYNKKKPTFEIL